MRAIRIESTGGPEVLKVQDVDPPAPEADQVLVEVAAAGVNFIDTYHRNGIYPLDLPTGLGMEGAGTVIAVGDDVSHRRVGDRVAWLDALGSYAEQHAVDAHRTVLVPEKVELETAAAAVLQGTTAHFLSHSTFPLRSDHTALVYAAAGGVGRLLVQFAKRRGARVLACVSTKEKADDVRSLGADEVILYRDVDVAAAVAELSDGQGVDVVYDSVGRDTFQTSLRTLRPRGTLVVFGQASGSIDPIDVQTLNHHGSLFLTRPAIGHYVASTDELDWRASTVFELLGQGALDLRVHARYGLDGAAAAQRDLTSGTTSGKLLLLPSR